MTTEDRNKAVREQAIKEELDRMRNLGIDPERYALDLVRAHEPTITQLFFTSGGYVLLTDSRGTPSDRSLESMPPTFDLIYLAAAKQYKEGTEGFPSAWAVTPDQHIYMPVLCDLWNQWLRLDKTMASTLLEPFMQFESGTKQGEIQQWFTRANPDFNPPRHLQRIEDDDPRFLPCYPRACDIVKQAQDRLFELTDGASIGGLSFQSRLEVGDPDAVLIDRLRFLALSMSGHNYLSTR